jgi:hypothetical protein
MITDRWDIVHIAIAVPDLERAMEEYTRGMGVEWGPVFDVRLPDDVEADPAGFTTDGLRATVQRAGTVAVAPLELVWAAPGSPAFELYGCPDGQDYLHHVAYWVDDFDGESRHLSDQGFEREMLCRREGKNLFAYHKSKTSMRIELYPAESKRA